MVNNKKGILKGLSTWTNTFRLLDDFAEEGEDEEGEDGAPDEGVEDHESPPEDTVGRGAKSVGNDVAWLTEETALEEKEEDKVDDTERNVCE